MFYSRFSRGRGRRAPANTEPDAPSTQVMNPAVTPEGTITWDAVDGATQYDVFILLASSSGTVATDNYDFTLDDQISPLELGPTENDVNFIVVATVNGELGTPSEIVFFGAT